MTETLDRIRSSLVGLRMPRALEALDHTMRQIERGELSALEALDLLLAEEHATRESRRIGTALKTARLMPPKTIESFDPGSGSGAGLLVPALARPGPHPGAGRARLRRPRRGRALPRASGHRQEPSGLSPRCGRGQGGMERLPLLAGGAGRGAEAGRTGGAPARQDPVPQPQRPADRRRDRLSADHAGRLEPVLPARQRAAHEKGAFAMGLGPMAAPWLTPHVQPRLRRVGRGRRPTPSSPPRCSTGSCTTPWSSRSRARATASERTPTSSRSTPAPTPPSPRHPHPSGADVPQRTGAPITDPGRSPNRPTGDFCRGTSGETSFGVDTWRPRPANQRIAKLTCASRIRRRSWTIPRRRPASMGRRAASGSIPSRPTPAAWRSATSSRGQDRSSTRSTQARTWSSGTRSRSEPRTKNSSWSRSGRAGIARPPRRAVTSKGIRPRRRLRWPPVGGVDPRVAARPALVARRERLAAGAGEDIPRRVAGDPLLGEEALAHRGAAHGLGDAGAHAGPLAGLRVLDLEGAAIGRRLDALRLALPEFRQTYDEHRLIERHGRRSPTQFRRDQMDRPPMAAQRQTGVSRNARGTRRAEPPGRTCPRPAGPSAEPPLPRPQTSPRSARPRTKAVASRAPTIPAQEWQRAPHPSRSRAARSNGLAVTGPRMVHPRRLRQPDLAHDLRAEVQRRAGPGPGRVGDVGPVPHRMPPPSCASERARRPAAPWPGSGRS